MVARVHVAVVLHRQRGSAYRRKDAQTRRLPGPARQRNVEHIDVDFRHVAAHPLLEDRDQEAPVLVSRDRALGDRIAELRIERPFAPGLVRHDFTRLIGFGLVSAHPHHALHDGDELDVLDAKVIAEEAVDFKRMVGVGVVDRHQGVELDSVLFQIVQAPDHAIEGGLAALVVAVGVVHSRPDRRC